MRQFFRVLLLLIACSAVRPAAAQLSSTYFFIRPIWALPGLKTKIGETTINVQDVEFTKGVYGSYARGLSFQAGVGKMISSNFGMELQGEWLKGSKARASLNTAADSVFATVADHMQAFLIKPMLVLRNSGDLLSIYSKVGMAIAFRGRSTSEQTILIQGATSAVGINATESDSYKTKVGFAAAFGLSFRISQSLAVATQLDGQMIALTPKDGRYRQFRRNGVDVLPSLTKSTKEWTFNREISSAPGDPDKPSQRLLEPANFSYVGVSVGINYYF